MSVDLNDLLKGGPGHDGYAYQADTYCVTCGRLIVCALHATGKLPATLDGCGDSEACPVPIFWGDHPDRAVHCANCGEYMYGTEPGDRDGPDFDDDDDDDDDFDSDTFDSDLEPDPDDDFDSDLEPDPAWGYRPDLGGEG